MHARRAACPTALGRASNPAGSGAGLFGWGSLYRAAGGPVTFVVAAVLATTRASALALRRCPGIEARRGLVSEATGGRRGSTLTRRSPR